MKLKRGAKQSPKPTAKSDDLQQISITIPLNLYEFAEAHAKALAPGMRPNISLAIRDILAKEKLRVERAKN